MLELKDLIPVQYEVARDDPRRPYDRVTLDRCEYEGGTVMWAIRHGDDFAFDKLSKVFVWESLPSNRKDGHEKFDRYNSIEEALIDCDHIKFDETLGVFRYEQ